MSGTCSTHWWRNLKESYRLEDLGIDGKIILKTVLSKWGRRMGIGFVWLRTPNSAYLL
jgi:hypothetical protein